MVEFIDKKDVRVTQVTDPWTISPTGGTIVLGTGTNLAGTITTSPSGTQDVNLVGDTVSLMLSTGGTIAQVTLVPTVTTVGEVSKLAGTVVVGAGANIIGAVKRDIVNYTKVEKDAQYTAAITDGTLWDPTGGTKFVITDIIISTKNATTITLEDDTAKIIEAYLADNGGFVSNFQTPIESASADNNLYVTTDTASTLSITVTGYEV